MWLARTCSGVEVLLRCCRCRCARSAGRSRSRAARRRFLVDRQVADLALLADRAELLVVLEVLRDLRRRSRRALRGTCRRGSWRPATLTRSLRRLNSSTTSLSSTVIQPVSAAWSFSTTMLRRTWSSNSSGRIGGVCIWRSCAVALVADELPVLLERRQRRDRARGLLGVARLDPKALASPATASSSIICWTMRWSMPELFRAACRRRWRRMTGGSAVHLLLIDAAEVVGGDLAPVDVRRRPRYRSSPCAPSRMEAGDVEEHKRDDHNGQAPLEPASCDGASGRALSWARSHHQCGKSRLCHVFTPFGRHLLCLHVLYLWRIEGLRGIRHSAAPPPPTIGHACVPARAPAIAVTVHQGGPRQPAAAVAERAAKPSVTCRRPRRSDPRSQFHA